MTDRGIPEQIKTGFNLLEPEDPTENIASNSKHTTLYFFIHCC